SPIVRANADDPALEMELGGDDRLLSDTFGKDNLMMEITTAGVIYVANPHFPGNTSPKEVEILRSADGGDTFELWSVFQHPGPLVISDVYDFVIAEGVSDRAFLAYTVWDAGSTTAHVARADLTPTAPTWLTTTLFPTAGTNWTMTIDLETDSGDFSDYYLYVALIDITAGERDIWFTRSLDQGANWETGYQAVSHLDHATEIGPRVMLSYGDGDFIHMAYETIDPPTFPPAPIFHRRAAAFAGGASPFGAATKIESNTDDSPAGLTALTASTGDGTVAVQLSSYAYSAIPAPSRLIWSADNGATWPAANTVDAGLGAYGRGDIDIDPMSGSVTLLGRNSQQGWGRLEIQTQHTTLSDLSVLDAPDRWTGQNAVIFDNAYDLERDPSHGNQLAVVWKTGASTSNASTKVHFDAEWHRSPGWPNMEAGFPKGNNTAFRSPPLIANIDDDPYGEIIVISEGASLMAFNHDGTAVPGLVFDTLDMIPFDSPVAVGDLNGDDQAEITHGTTDGRVFAYDNKGNRMPGWPVDLGTDAAVYVSIGALGAPYARYVVACSGQRMVVLDYKGRDVSPGWGTAVGQLQVPAAIGDVDGDGVAEIVFRQTGAITVHRLDSYHSQAFRIYTGETLSGMPALADFDNDGDLEIMVGTTDGKVYLMHHDLTDYSPAFPYDTGNNSAVMGVVPVDLLGNNTPELVFSQHDGTTHIVLESGISGFNYPKQTGPSELVYMPPIVTNVFGPTPDVVLSAGDKLYCWENLGAVPTPWPHTLPGLIEECVAAGDIDLDGNIELVVASLGQLTVLDVGNPPNPSPHRTWPMYGYNAQRTGCLDCTEGTVSAVEDPITLPTSRLAFAPPYPNPATTRTALSYSLPQAAQVKLQIFDVRGRLIRTLADGQQEAGIHEMFWNGTAANGRRVALGLYLAKLAVNDSDGSQERVRKISLVR
ncbi:MAG: FlgD immunoglobulin-like domain containing protein, partial [Candidatus Krumholzibacteria bacterium]|nr:FlgD immunoglobulin-like domain containing protein [Candidatus Krumholzibacteria bacterium]